MIRTSLLLLTLACDTGGLGSTTVGDGSATLPIGDQPIGNRYGGAELFFELGDPASPTYGPIQTDTDPPITGLTLLARYVADDMPASSSGSWPGTGSMAVDLVGTGTATPTQDGRRVVASTTYAHTEGNTWRAASASSLNFGTDDLLLIGYARRPTSGHGYLFSNQHSGDGGIEMRFDTSGTTRCQMRTATSGLQNDQRSAAHDANAWQWMACIVDRDGYLAAWGSNTGSGSATSISASAADDLHSATYRATVGGSPVGDTIYDDDFGWFEVWGCSDCLTEDATGDAYTTELLAYRDRQLGATALNAGSEVTTSLMTRNSSGYIRSCAPGSDDAVLELIADDIPLVELACGQTWDTFTGATLYRGFHHEAGLTNVFTSHEDPTAVAWTKTNATAVADSSCGGTLFAHDATCTEVRAATTNDEQKSIAQGGANTAEEDHAWFALKAGAVDYAIVTAGGTNWVKWDLTDCTVAAQGAGVDFAGDWAFRNGWCWAGMSGDAAQTTVTVIPCDADTASGTCSYAAGDTTSAQVEFRHAVAVANINNEHGYVSPEPPNGRNKDIMEFPITTAAGPLTVVLDASDMRNDSLFDLTVLSDDDANAFAMSKSALKFRAYGDTATVRDFEAGSSTDFPTTGRHIFRATWAADDGKIYIDGTQEGTDADTNGNEPAAYGFIYFGKSNATEDRQHGTIWDVRLYAGAHAPGEAGTGDDTP